MAWMLDNIDFADYGITVFEAEGVLNAPSIQDMTHNWLDRDYSVAIKDTGLSFNDREINITCTIQSDTYEGFASQCAAFMNLIKSPNRRQLLHPYSVIPVVVYVIDEIKIDKLINWNEEKQAGRFILRLIAPEYKYPQHFVYYSGATGAYKGIVTRNKDAKIQKVLMGVNEITFSVESNIPLSIVPNDFILIGGQKYIHLEEIKFVKHSTNKYVYNLKFEHETFRLRNVLIKDLDLYTEFYYNSKTIREIVELIVDNVEERYPGLVVVGDVLTTTPKNHHIKSENGYDLLKRICEEEDIEFMFQREDTHYRINVLSRVSFPIPGVTFQYGEESGLYTIERAQQNKEEFCNILYVYGGTKNLPFGSTGSRLASRLNPIVNAASVAMYGPIEKDKIFEEIYPRGTRTVKGYTFREGTFKPAYTTVIDGVTVDVPRQEITPNEYIVRDPAIGFDINALLTKDPAKLVFNTGQLAGYEFVIKRFVYVEGSVGDIYISPVSNEKEVTLPGGFMIPAIGDEYIITNINPPEIFTTEALNELDAVATLYSQDVSVVKNNYTVTVDPKYIADFEANEGMSFDTIQVGNTVNIIDDDYSIPETPYRIVSMTTKVDTGEVDMELADVNKLKATVLLQKIKIAIARLQRIQQTLKLFDVDHLRKSTGTIGDLVSDILNPIDKFLNSAKIRPENVDPLHLAYDSGTPQYSLKNGTIQPNFEGNPSALRVNAGEFIHHSYNALDRVNIAKLKEANVPYDPTRTWNIEQTDINIPDDDGYFMYIKVPTA